jgi:prepilin-type N-terminal cleavage/methylation domain-containing protein
MRGKRQVGEAGFTLVELLVVIALMIVIATLGYLVLPGLFNNYSRVRAADQVAGWLLSAKQRAKRDGLPTGLRLVYDTDPNTGVVVSNGPLTYGGMTFANSRTYWIRQVQYVQQPEPLVGGRLDSTATGATYTGGYLTGITLDPKTNTNTATFANVDFTGGTNNSVQYLVQPGDYLEVFGGGGVHKIAAVVSGTTLQLADTSNAINFNGNTTSYRILRQARPLQGEDLLQLPGSMVIDLGVASQVVGGNPTSFQRPVPDPAFNLPPPPMPNPVPSYVLNPSQNLPERLLAANQPVVLDILFSPAGGLMGVGGAATANIYLWVRDTSATPPDNGGPTIIGIKARTGYIGTHDVYPSPDSPDPVNTYKYAQDSRGSGM